jgi:hypothetical protein
MSKALETNPWFGYYVARDGRRAALREALNIGRETMTTPGKACETCGKPTWYRPLVEHYTCYDCQPGNFGGYVDDVRNGTAR